MNLLIVPNIVFAFNNDLWRLINLSFIKFELVSNKCIVVQVLWKADGLLNAYFEEEFFIVLKKLIYIVLNE